MIEIRFHGRGGQGAVVASNILAAAAFKEGKDVQAFPYFGVERRGAPVTAFTKIDDRPIRVKSQIYEPDYIIVLDSALVKTIDVAQGLKKDGLLLLNTDKSPGEVRNLAFPDLEGKIATVDATGIALKHHLGSKTAPIVNTPIIGAFAKVSKIVAIESIAESIMETVPAKREENTAAARDAYGKAVIEK